MLDIGIKGCQREAHMFFTSSSVRLLPLSPFPIAGKSEQRLSLYAQLPKCYTVREQNYFKEV